MSRKWIDDLAVAAAAAADRNKRHDEETRLFEAAVARVREEIETVVDALNQRFQLRLAIHSESGSVVITAQAPTGKYKSARIFVDAVARRLTSQPEGGMASPPDRHQFQYDFDSLAFAENNEELSDEELVRRALDSFLRSNVAATK